MRKHKHLAVLALSALIFSSAIMTTSCGGNATEEKQTFKVNVTTGNGYTVDGIKADGYKEGEKVTFTVAVTDNTKEIDKVTVNNSVLEGKSGTYEFEMPAQDTTIGVLLKDKQGGSTTDPDKPADPDKPTDPEEVPTEYAIGQITTEGETYTIRGVVVAKSEKSLVLHDGKDAVYLYGKEYVDFEINDYLEVSGKVSTYNGLLQFSGSTKSNPDGAVATKLTETAPKIDLTAIDLTADIATSWASGNISNKDIKLYKWTTTVGSIKSKDQTFLTFNINGSDVDIECLYLPASFGIVEGKTYEVEAFFTGYSTNNSYAAMILTKATEVGGELPQPEPEPEPEPQPSDYSIGQVTEAEKHYTVRGEVVAKSEKSIVIHDGVTAGYVYGAELTKKAEIGNLVEVSGRANLYNGMLQFAKNSTYTDTTLTVITGEDVPDISSIPLTKTIADSWKTTSSFKASDIKHYKWTAFACEETFGKDSFTTLYLDGSDTNITPLYLSADYGIVPGKTYEVEGYFVGYHKEETFEYACVVLTTAKLVENVDVEPTGIEIVNGETAEMYVNNKLQLEYKPTPINVTKQVTWESDNKAIATVDENGLVTGLAVGEATITAKYSDTIKDSIKITVKEAPAVQSIVLTTESMGITGGYNSKTRETNVAGVGFKYDYLMFGTQSPNEGAIQTKNKNGKSLIWNTSPTQKAIKSIKFEFTSEPSAKAQMKIAFGTSSMEEALTTTSISMLENPTVTCDVENATFFRFERYGSNTVYIKSITIDFVE